VHKVGNKIEWNTQFVDYFVILDLNIEKKWWCFSVPTVQPTRRTSYLKLFILEKRSTYFRLSLRPSSGAQNCAYSNGICQTAAATCCHLYMFRTVFPSIIRSSKLRIQQLYMSNSCCYLLLSGMRWIAGGISSCLTYTVAVYAVLSSWWWTGRPSETCRGDSR